MTVRDAAAGVWLAPHIHVASDGGDLVVLDVEADAYYCLPQAAASLVVIGEGEGLAGLSPDTVEALTRIGAVCGQACGRRSPRMTAPARDLSGRLAGDVRPGELWDFAASIIEGVIRFRRQDLKALISRREGAARANLEVLERRARVFRTLWPWSPVQGACLFQALVLRIFLRRAGADCDWVFGVRTWPFAAHCWLRAYDFTTDRGAAALSDYARGADPFSKVGQVQVGVDVSSVIRASPSSFRVAWTERRYVDGALVSTERWTAILGVIVQRPRTADEIRRNPLGIYVHSLDWSKELG